MQQMYNAHNPSLPTPVPSLSPWHTIPSQYPSDQVVIPQPMAVPTHPSVPLGVQTAASNWVQTRALPQTPKITTMEPSPWGSRRPNLLFQGNKHINEMKIRFVFGFFQCLLISAVNQDCSKPEVTNNPEMGFCLKYILCWHVCVRDVCKEKYAHRKVRQRYLWFKTILLLIKAPTITLMRQASKIRQPSILVLS